MIRVMSRVLRWSGAAAVILALSASTLAAQQATVRRLTLDEALRLGADASEAVAIARAGVERAQGLRQQARSEFYPQLSGSASYTRTLASQFSAAVDDSASEGPPPPECRRFTGNPDLPIAERVDSLESALECAADQDPFALFSDLPFGRENQYSIGLQASQTLFAGGRVRAQSRVADAGLRSARIALASEEALLTLDVTRAYYDAVLAERLLEIADSTLAQAERTLENTRLAEEVGNVAEFELLRAQVARDNARPAVIQGRANRDVAILRLKQLLELPASDSLVLVTTLGDSSNVLPPPSIIEEQEGDTAVDSRAFVRLAAENVTIREGQLDVANAARWPTVRLSSSYARFAYPDDVVPAWGDFVSDWTVTLGLTVPLFTGGRIAGERRVARADLEEARLQLKQARELAQLDARSIEAELEAAEAAWDASAGVVEQAQRAYAIAEVRYQEGISTQTELGDARVQLQQAVANRAQSARDLQVARVRNALLPELPAR